MPLEYREPCQRAQVLALCLCFVGPLAQFHLRRVLDLDRDLVAVEPEAGDITDVVLTALDRTVYSIIDLRREVICDDPLHPRPGFLGRRAASHHGVSS